MNIYYLDASALVKRYVNETGSNWIRSLLERQPLLFSSRMVIIEVISAFARRKREGSLSSAEFTTARNALRSDCLNEYHIIPPSMEIIDLASELLAIYPLRAYDAVHLATALTAQQFLVTRAYPALTFLAADNRLNSAASSAGLTIDNPNHHL